MAVLAQKAMGFFFAALKNLPSARGAITSSEQQHSLAPKDIKQQCFMTLFSCIYETPLQRGGSTLGASLLPSYHLL